MRNAIVSSVHKEIRASIQTRWLKRWKFYRAAAAIKKLKHAPNVKIKLYL